MAQDESLASWTNNYIKRLQQIGASAHRIAPVAQIQQTPRMDFSSITHSVQGPAPQDSGTSALDAVGGAGSWLLDKLSRPLHAAANVSNDLVKNIKGDPTASDNPFASVWSGLNGDANTTFADVARNAIPQDWGTGNFLGNPSQDLFQKKMQENASPLQATRGSSNVRNIAVGSAGLVGDTVLDPINYIPFGKLASLARGAKAIEKIGPLPLKTAREALDQTPLQQFVSSRDAEAFGKANPGTASTAPTTQTGPMPFVDQMAETATRAADNGDLMTNTINNAPRKAGESTILKNYDMQRITRESVASAAADVRAAMPKYPSYMHEVDPDIYHSVKNIVAQTPDRYITPSTLMNYVKKATGVEDIGFKDATRYLTLMEKDGLVSKAKLPPGKTGSRNTLYDINRDGVPDGPSIAEKYAADTPESRQRLMMEASQQALRKAFDAQEARGILPQIHASDGSAYHLSTADILESIPEQARLDLQYNPDRMRNLYPSQWNSGAAEALRTAELGMDPSLRTKAIADAMRKAVDPGATRAAAIDANGSIDSAAATLADATGTLLDRLQTNSMRFAQKDLIDAAAIGKTKAGEVFDNIESGPTSDAINSVANIGGDINKMAREAGATDSAAVQAAHDVAPTIAKVVTEPEIATARAVKAVARNNEKLGPKAAPKNKERISRLTTMVNDTADRIASMANLDIVTLGEKFDLRHQTWIDTFMNPIRAKFSFGAGTGDLANLMRSSVGSHAKAAVGYRRSIAAVDKQFGDQAKGAFSALKSGKIFKEGEPLYEAQQAIIPLVNHVFDTGDALLGRLFRNGASVDELNHALDTVTNLDKGYRFKTEIEGKPQSMADVADQWRKWPMSDPLSDLEKINTAISRVEAKQTVGLTFSHQFGHATPMPGDVRISANKLSEMGSFVDGSKSYPKEAAEMMGMLDQMMRAKTSFKGEKGAIAWTANNILDPVMRYWKPSVTILRPGHHVRNFFSDIVMNTFDGVMSARHYKAASDMMAVGGRLEKDVLQSTEELYHGALRQGPRKMVTVKLKNGKTADLSYEAGYQMAAREGLLPDFAHVEDFMDGGGTGYQKFLGSAPMKAAGKLSEAYSNLSRLAQYHALLERPSFTRSFDSMEQASAAARERVLRFHPDVKGLTPFETKYMRRLVPFYSWIRQAIPVILETTMLHPGRVTAIPKIQYNLQIAMGQDPQSMSNPWPVDKLYPSFITDNLSGPILGSVGMNWGTPTEAMYGDILNGNPINNLVGMVNPLLKAPVELGRGTYLEAGTNPRPIPDKGEYIDALLPGLNQVSNLSGYSATGTLANLGVPDPQRAVVKGEKQHLWNLQLANFLSGIGFYDTEKPSYIKIAARENNQ